jgi:hypothetical protein
VFALTSARLVRWRVVGRTHICRIEGKSLAETDQLLEEFRRNRERNFLRLDVLLDQRKAEERDKQTGHPNR